MNYLLLIAIGAYRHWNPLVGPPCDAERLKAVLFDRYGFAPERMVELRDEKATAEAVVAAFETLSDALTAADNLLIYFAGHGGTAPAGTYWITHEAGTGKHDRQGRIHHAEVRSLLTQMAPRHILLICDSCFGGDLFEKRNLAPVARPDGWLEIARQQQSREILTSGASEPVADSSLSGHSPFAYHLLKTLEDFSGPGLDPVGLYDHIRRGVTGQTPLYGSLKNAGHADGGAFLFVPDTLCLTPAMPMEVRPPPPPPVAAWHVAAGEQTSGPFSQAALRAEIATGRVARGTLVWSATIGVWTQAGNVPALAGLFPAVTVPRPPPVAPPPPPPKPTPSSQTPVAGDRMAVDLGKNVKLELVWIPPGTFMMGEKGIAEPVHKVTLSRGFWLGKYPVTQEQYEAVSGINPSNFQGDQRPVEQVDYQQADAFCKELEKLFKATGAGMRASLPTEAQWEYACRAGTTTEYGTGDGESALQRAGWYNGNSGAETHDVGQKEPNAWGLYDMHGNVWEWCLDWYGYYTASHQTDPTGPDSGSARVLRGGSWRGSAQLCRSALRCNYAPARRYVYIGFRVVCSPMALL